MASRRLDRRGSCVVGRCAVLVGLSRKTRRRGVRPVGCVTLAGVAVCIGEARGGMIDAVGATLGGVAGADAVGVVPPATLGGSSGM